MWKMSYRKLEKSEVKKVFFIALSNIGDCILTLPVLDALKENFPQALFTVMVGPKARELFVGDNRVERLITYEKKKSWRDNAKFTLDLREERFDIVVDLRNTAFPLFLKSRLKTMPFLRIPRDLTHMKERHMYRLKSVLDFRESKNRLSIFTSQMGKEYVEKILKDEGVLSSDKLFFISPGAANTIKQWNADSFSRVADKLIVEFSAKIIFVGDDKDKPVVEGIISGMKHKSVNLCGKVTLRELSFLLGKAALLISCDSAVMHLGSYLNIPVFVIFGPTDPLKYGPWSKRSSFYKMDLSCSPCEKSGCSQKHECMEMVSPEDVFNSIKKFIEEGDVVFEPPKAASPSTLSVPPTPELPKRILIIRTDRIGDVILTTPVIKALRKAQPKSFIAMMVNPVGKGIVEGNPYLDEVIVYDKKGRDSGIFGFLNFVLNLKRRNFALSLNLHTKKRVNLISYLAGIKERIGYDNNKFSGLLTRRLKDLRIEGKKHEAEYCLDVLKAIGIKSDDKELFMPIKESAEKWADGLLRENNIKSTDTLIAIHPDASCPSKRWPIERFAQVCNKLIEEKGFKVAIISGPKDSYIVKMVKRYLRHPVIDLSGKTTVSQLASFLKRCKLLISNDSGPVHVASALGVAVIAIFGRNQAGLSPKRWGPLGENNIILYRDVKCKICLAHNCKIGFMCLSVISVKDVLEAVDRILKKK